MKATPLKVQGNVDSYTRFRTSKVMYMNEAVYPVAKSLSRNIDLAMKFNVQSKYGSENYQVMNYGMGGSIISHLDSTGESSRRDDQEHKDYGGARLTTFMIYLSNIQAGGHTVIRPLCPTPIGRCFILVQFGLCGGLRYKKYSFGLSGVAWQQMDCK